jgi:hypothetical protein
LLSNGGVNLYRYAELEKVKGELAAAQSKIEELSAADAAEADKTYSLAQPPTIVHYFLAVGNAFAPAARRVGSPLN